MEGIYNKWVEVNTYAQPSENKEFVPSSACVAYLQMGRSF